MPRIFRDLFTGELREEEFTGEGRQIIARIDPPYEECSRSTDPYSGGREFQSDSLAVPVYQVQQFNEELKRNGVRNAYYHPKTGRLHASSKQGRKGAARARGYHDEQSYGLGGDP